MYMIQSEQRASKKTVESRMKRTSVLILKKCFFSHFCTLLLFTGVFLRLHSNNGGRRVQNTTQRQFTTHFDFFPFPLYPAELSSSNSNKRRMPRRRNQVARKKYASANNNRYWKAKMLKILPGQLTHIHTNQPFLPLPTYRIRSPRRKSSNG